MFRIALVVALTCSFSTNMSIHLDFKSGTKSSQGHKELLGIRLLGRRVSGMCCCSGFPFVEDQ